MGIHMYNKNHNNDNVQYCINVSKAFNNIGIIMQQLKKSNTNNMYKGIEYCMKAYNIIKQQQQKLQQHVEGYSISHDDIITTIAYDILMNIGHSYYKLLLLQKQKNNDCHFKESLKHYMEALEIIRKKNDNNKLDIINNNNNIVIANTMYHIGLLHVEKEEYGTKSSNNNSYDDDVENDIVYKNDENENEDITFVWFQQAMDIYNKCKNIELIYDYDYAISSTTITNYRHHNYCANNISNTQKWIIKLKQKNDNGSNIIHNIKQNHCVNLVDGAREESNNYIKKNNIVITNQTTTTTKPICQHAVSC